MQYVSALYKMKDGSTHTLLECKSLEDAATHIQTMLCGETCKANGVMGFVHYNNCTYSFEYGCTTDLFLYDLVMMGFQHMIKEMQKVIEQQKEKEC